MAKLCMTTDEFKKMDNWASVYDMTLHIDYLCKSYSKHVNERRPEDVDMVFGECGINVGIDVVKIITEYEVDILCSDLLGTLKVANRWMENKTNTWRSLSIYISRLPYIPIDMVKRNFHLFDIGELMKNVNLSHDYLEMFNYGIHNWLILLKYNDFDKFTHEELIEYLEYRKIADALNRIMRVGHPTLNKMSTTKVFRMLANSPRDFDFDSDFEWDPRPIDDMIREFIDHSYQAFANMSYSAFSDNEELDFSSFFN